MTLRLAVRSLLTRPVRTLVLCCGFGFGIAVMAALLGVGEVILEQARAPALVGGGDVLITGANGPIGSARFLTSSVLASPPFSNRMIAASPLARATLYLVRGTRVSRITARAGVPSLLRAVGDPEAAQLPHWNDAPQDLEWSAPDAGSVLRAMDRFHPIPDAPRWSASWAEWLYFNARSPEGTVRIYLTFLVGGPAGPGLRRGGVRLQVERSGEVAAYSMHDVIDEASLLASAPDLTIGRSRVRLEGSTYRISLELPSERGGAGIRGEVSVQAVPGRAMPPFTLRGARGWMSGYVVPVLSGPARIALEAGPLKLNVADAIGYHDHNWGFWEGVTWQWGQVSHGDLAFVYGRVHPPADAADADRIPGFLGVLGPDGPLGFSTKVTIDEIEDPEAARRGSKAPTGIHIRASGQNLAVDMMGSVEDSIGTRMGGWFDAKRAGGLSLLQLRTRFHVVGRVGSRAIDFTELGSAESFRGE